ncbi:MAG: SelB C-terminal domain-containing protein, partial [Nitrospirota bacterium]
LRGVPVAEVEGWLKAEVPEISRAVDELLSQGRIKRYGDVLVHAEAHEAFRQALKKRLDEFHRKNPLRHGMPKEELRGALRMEPKIFAGMISSLDEVSVEKDLLRLKSFKAAISEEDKSRVLKLLEQRGFQPPEKKDITGELKTDEKRVSDILGFLAKEGSAVRVNDSLYLSRASYDRLIELLKQHFASKPEMTVAEFRDLLSTTRKYALPYLEYLDSNNITLRVGDVRKLILK